MITKNYIINTKKFNENIKIALFSDIHYSNIFKLKRFEEIKRSLTLNKPDYICIPGDIINSTNILDDISKKETIINFFKEIGSIAPTYISLGNHDYSKIINKEAIEDLNNFWFNEIKKLEKNRVYLLNNEILETNLVRFIGFNPPLNYYYNDDKNIKEESCEILVKIFNQKIKYFDDNKLNVLLFHSPVCITNEYVINNIKTLENIDIILTGHMHNGMIPIFLEKIFPINRGIIAPDKTLYPDNARGVKKFKIKEKEKILIISGGITKIQESAPKILHFGDYLYKPQIEYIDINYK